MNQFRPSGFQVLPPVVKNIIIINLLMLITTAVIGKTVHIDISKYLALYQWDSPNFHSWQLITHMFMHGDVGIANPNYEEGFLHIFGNMFALWMFGSVLENTWGSKRFIEFYLMCGLGAALLHLGVLSYENVATNEGTVGASGAVFGVLFAFAYLFPSHLCLWAF